MGLSARTKLGPYEVVVLLGAEGIGVVYRVRDATLGRATAVRCCRRGMRRIPLAKSWGHRRTPTRSPPGRTPGRTAFPTLRVPKSSRRP